MYQYEQGKKRVSDFEFNLLCATSCCHINKLAAFGHLVVDLTYIHLSNLVSLSLNVKWVQVSLTRSLVVDSRRMLAVLPKIIVGK